MGCSESKTSVAAGNTTTQRKKQSEAGASPVDETKVESVEKAVIPLDDKVSEGAEDAMEVTRDAEVASEVEKEDAAKEKPEEANENAKEEKAVEEKEPEKETGLSFPSSLVVLNASDIRQDPTLKGEFPVCNAGAKEVANNEEGSIKEAEPGPATPSPKVAKTAGSMKEVEPALATPSPTVAETAGSIKEVEPAPATPYPMVAETTGTIVSEESNPPYVSFHAASRHILKSCV